MSAAEKAKSYLVSEIPSGCFFSEPVYLDESFVLTAPEMPFTEKLAKALFEWGVMEVFSGGTPMEDYAADKAAQNEEIGVTEATQLSDSEKIARVGDFIADFRKYVEILFTQAAAKEDLEFNPIAGKIKNACEIIREDRRFILRELKNRELKNIEKSGNYLVSHAVKSAIISIVIGGYIKLPAHRLIELGVAALLHEIGMIKLPPEIYLSKRPLKPGEKEAVMTHPVLGYNLLKSFDFPLTVTMAVLEHHERENGSGYPQKLTGDKISLYAKIIAVACSYEALSSRRPHKKAKDGYTGMLELLKNEGKQYDETIVRALVFSLSIYPVGLYVLLSSGRKGQVVDVNPENPRFPIVQVFGELTPDGKNKILETSNAGVYIVRPLTREEIGAESTTTP